jgi:gamma-glutamyl-gamma-aminobutyrate hydrolase PuuD
VGIFFIFNNKEDMKVFVVGGDTSYARWLKDYTLVDKLSEADLVFFTGGEDVTPKLYGCKEHRTTYCNPARDSYEQEIFQNIRPDQGVLGVCRGSQFLCVMNGGKLIQNCNNHAIWGTHQIFSETGESYQITSTHHQMAYPFELSNDDYEILFYANHRSTIYEGDGIDPEKVIKEPEIVLYHKINKPVCLGIQGHPEMMTHTELHDMLNDLITQCIL